MSDPYPRRTPPDDQADPDRRRLLGQAAGIGAAMLGGGWIAASLYAAGAVPGPPPRSLDTGVQIEALLGVRVVGPVLLVPTGGSPPAPRAKEARGLAMPPPSESGVIALDRRCTHLGCLVAPHGEELRCPCHGSRFDRQGRPLWGPARRPLARLRVSVAPDGHLWVHGLRRGGPA